MLRHAYVPCGLLVAFGLVLPAAPGQETKKPPKTKHASAEPVARLVYAVHGGAVKDLANALSFHFQAEPSFQAFPDARSKSLLLSGPKAVLDEALAMLREIDRPARTIHMEVLFLELASGDANALDGIELTGPARDVKAKIRELQQKGLIISVKTFQITSVEGESTRSRISESRPFVTGVNVAGFGGGGFGGRGGAGGGGPGAGPMTRSISYREVGTSVQVKADIGPDGPVVVDLRIEDSHMRAVEDAGAVGKEDKGPNVPATEVVTSTLDTRLRVRPGHMVIAQGTKTSSKSGQAQTVILVTAGSDEALSK